MRKPDQGVGYHKNGMVIENLTGMIFGLLTAISYIGDFKWLCQCSCPKGNTKEVKADHLKEGKVKSCGCLRLPKDTKCKTQEYKIWKEMRQRCYNPNRPQYKDYGGRGIRVCERWNDYDNFISDMGPRPGPEYSIDRIDVNEDYTPENCRWATKTEQNNNKRNNRLLTYDEKTQTLAEWSKETGIVTDTIDTRLRSGWDIEKALTESVQIIRKFTKEEKDDVIEKYQNGYSMQELGRQYNRTCSTIKQMLQREGVWQKKIK